MWFFLISVVAVILTVLLFPYASVIVARHRAISALRIKLRHLGGRMRTLRRFPSCSANRTPKYDILVEKDDTFYAVKFWSAAHRNADLRIRADGKVGEERTTTAPLTPRGRVIEKKSKYSARPVPKTKYNFKVPNGKRVVRVVLVYPSYRSVILEKGSEICELHSGDLFFDKIILTPYAFLRLLSDGNDAE